MPFYVNNEMPKILAFHAINGKFFDIGPKELGNENGKWWPMWKLDKVYPTSETNMCIYVI